MVIRIDVGVSLNLINIIQIEKGTHTQQKLNMILIYDNTASSLFQYHHHNCKWGGLFLYNLFMRKYTTYTHNTQVFFLNKDRCNISKNKGHCKRKIAQITKNSEFIIEPNLVNYSNPLLIIMHILADYLR